MRFTRGDVRDHIVSSKIGITDLRSGAKERCDRREAQDQLSRDSLGCSIFDFCNNIGQKPTSSSGFCLRKEAAPVPGRGWGRSCRRADARGHSRRVMQQSC